MKEKDILHENGGLWVCKDKNLGFCLNFCTVTHSIGFLSFETLAQAIDNCESLALRPDLVANLIK
jgi:hypothetical protein